MTTQTGAAIGAAVLVWGLAACGAAPPASGPATTSPATTSPATPGSPAVAPASGSAAEAPRAEAPRHPPLSPLALAPSAPDSRSAIEDLPGPDALIGQSSDVVTASLGAPEFRRLEAPAEIWRYRTKVCFLDLFLYRDGTVLTVAHVEARGHGVVAVGKKACYRGLLVERSRAKAL